jgi:glutamine synthetase
MNPKQNLQKASSQFTLDTSFTPILGAELEFYLSGEIPTDIIEIITHYCKKVYLPIFDVKKEEGRGQYEVSLLPTGSAIGLADDIILLKNTIAKMAAEYNLTADFSAKPFADDYGNALHIHISVLDGDGINMLQKEGDAESEIMLYAIGGLLAKMLESMQYFAPYPACYDRLKGGKDAPSTISWGGNNRTVALRLPTTTTEPQNRRIEHRVAAADADPYLVIAAILEGGAYGIANKVLPESEKIYGDAGLEVYGLVQLIT